MECFGRCKQQVHTRCLAVPKQEIEVLRKNKNAVYVCDVCLELNGFDDRAKIEDTMNEVTLQMKKLQCVIDFVDKFDAKVRKIFKEECGKIVAGKMKVDSNENVTPGRVLRSAKKRKMMEQTENTAGNPSLEASTDTPRSCVGNSFADAVKQNPTRVQNAGSNSVVRVVDKRQKFQKPNPKLVIKAKESTSAVNLGKMLKEKIDRKSLCIQDVKTRQDGTVVVEMLNADSVNELKERVVKCMGDQCEVELPEAPKPTVKLVGMAEKYEEEDLKATLIQDNPILSEMSHFKLRRCYAASKDEDCKFNAIFEVDAVTHRKILEKRRLLCDWDSCPVFDGLDVLRCYKCCGFNHKGSECKENENTCPRCAGSHSVKQCESTVLRCTNCVKLKKNDPASSEHAAWSEVCPVYQSLKNKKKKLIDYSE